MTDDRKAMKCGASSPGGGHICELKAGHDGPHGCDVGKGDYAEWVMYEQATQHFLDETRDQLRRGIGVDPGPLSNLLMELDYERRKASDEIARLRGSLLQILEMVRAEAGPPDDGTSNPEPWYSFWLVASTALEGPSRE